MGNMAGFCQNTTNKVVADHCDFLVKTYGLSEADFDREETSCIILKDTKHCNRSKPDGKISDQEVLNIFFKKGEEEYKEFVRSKRELRGDVKTPFLEYTKKKGIDIPFFIKDPVLMERLIRATQKAALENDNTYDLYRDLMKLMFDPVTKGGLGLYFVDDRILSQEDIDGAIERKGIRCVEFILVLKGLVLLTGGEPFQTHLTVRDSENQHVFGTVMDNGAYYLLDAQESKIPVQIEAPDAYETSIPISDAGLMAIYNVILSNDCPDFFEKEGACTKPFIEAANNYAPDLWPTIINTWSYYFYKGDLQRAGQVIEQGLSLFPESATLRQYLDTNLIP